MSEESLKRIGELLETISKGSNADSSNIENALEPLVETLGGIRKELELIRKTLEQVHRTAVRSYGVMRT